MFWLICARRTHRALCGEWHNGRHKKIPAVAGTGLIFGRFRPVNVGGLRCIHARQQYAVFSPGIIAALFSICCHIQINSILQGFDFGSGAFNERCFCCCSFSNFCSRFRRLICYPAFTVPFIIWCQWRIDGGISRIIARHGNLLFCSGFDIPDGFAAMIRQIFPSGQRRVRGGSTANRAGWQVPHS